VWVINWVHNNTADGWANTLPPLASRLTPVDVGLLSISNLTDGCAAVGVNVSDFT
jgi:hypothetical protein